jgi:hypothetical protein
MHQQHGRLRGLLSDALEWLLRYWGINRRVLP